MSKIILSLPCQVFIITITVLLSEVEAGYRSSSPGRTDECGSLHSWSGRARGPDRLSCGSSSWNYHVDARFIGLLRSSTEPKPLQDTSPCHTTGTSQRRWDGNVKVGVVGWKCREGFIGIANKTDQGSTNGGIGGSIDNTDIHGTFVRDRDCSEHIDHLTRLESLHIRSVVGKLEAFAQENIAGGRIEIWD